MQTCSFGFFFPLSSEAPHTVAQASLKRGLNVSTPTPPKRVRTTTPSMPRGAGAGQAAGAPGAVHAGSCRRGGAGRRLTARPFEFCREKRAWPPGPAPRGTLRGVTVVTRGEGAGPCRVRRPAGPGRSVSRRPPSGAERSGRRRRREAAAGAARCMQRGGACSSRSPGRPRAQHRPRGWGCGCGVREAPSRRRHGQLKPAPLPMGCAGCIAWSGAGPGRTVNGAAGAGSGGSRRLAPPQRRGAGWGAHREALLCGGPLLRNEDGPLGGVRSPGLGLTCWLRRAAWEEGSGAATHPSISSPPHPARRPPKKGNHGRRRREFAASPLALASFSSFKFIPACGDRIGGVFLPLSESRRRNGSRSRAFGGGEERVKYRAPAPAFVWMLPATKEED